MAADPWAWVLDLEGVPSELAAARDEVDVVLRDRGRRRTLPEDTVEALLCGAHASAVLEGSGSTLAQMREGAADQTARAALRLYAELLAQGPVLARSPLQCLARLHALAAAGTLPADQVGRPRDAAAAGRLQTLAALLTTPTRAPALAVAAVVHAEVATVAPFASHNGLVARAAERLILVGRGLDPRSVLVPEAGHLAMRASYTAGLQAYRVGGDDGARGWLLHVARATIAGAVASPVSQGRPAPSP